MLFGVAEAVNPGMCGPYAADGTSSARSAICTGRPNPPLYATFHHVTDVGLDGSDGADRDAGLEHDGVGALTLV